MTTKWQHTGNVMDMVAPSGGVTSGVPLIIGITFGIPEKSAAEGDQFPFRVVGVNTLPKATGFAPTTGNPAYFDEADGELNSDTANPCVGVYEGSPGSSATTADVKLFGPIISDFSALGVRVDNLEARKGVLRIPISLTANGTYKTYASLPQAATITSAKLITPTVFASTGGGVTLAVKKTNSAGNTILNAATYNLESALADVATALTLTATGADKQIAADGLIYVAVVSDDADATGPAESGACVVINYTLDV